MHTATRSRTWIRVSGTFLSVSLLAHTLYLNWRCRAETALTRHLSRHSVSHTAPPTAAATPLSFFVNSTFSLTALPSGSYGLKLTGKSPAMVAQIQSGSVADKAGLIVGDFVLKVSGQETRSSEAEKVLQLLKERVGRAVEVVVARPYPVPVTDKEKMRALIVLQTKVCVCALIVVMIGGVLLCLLSTVGQWHYLPASR